MAKKKATAAMLPTANYNGLLGDEAWRTGHVSYSSGPDPDGSEGLLALLDSNPLTYRSWAEDYYGEDCDEDRQQGHQRNRLPDLTTLRCWKFDVACSLDEGFIPRASGCLRNTSLISQFAFREPWPCLFVFYELK